MNKTRTIIIVSIASILLVIGIIGGTYAWYTTVVTGEAKAVVVTTANLGTITYTDGQVIDMNNAYPGATRTKTFTIVSSQDTTVDNQGYEITLEVTSNTMTPVASGAFVYSLSGTTTTNGGTLVSVTDRVVPQTTTRIGTGSINKKATHTYTFTLNLKDTGTDQNALQTKVFNAKINVKAYTPPVTLADAIKQDNNGGKSDASVNFGTVSSTSGDLGLYYTAGPNLSYTEGGKVSYYYRGAVQNNFVKFGKNSSNQDLYWRIIRIDEDGNIRLIYNGTSTVQTGTTTQIGTSAFNTNRDQNAYVGYMYGTPGSTTYEAEHANTNNSTIKTTIDNWFASNMTEERSYLSEDAVYCNDRGLSTGAGVGATLTDYKAYARLNTNKRPDYRCSQTNDQFTTTTATKGNKKLIYPVGLITADETSFAGGVNNSANSDFYLNTAQYYWPLSPSYFSKGYMGSRLFSMRDDGSFFFDNSNCGNGVRPTVSLKSNTEVLKGNGTASSSYEIKM